MESTKDAIGLLKRSGPDTKYANERRRFKVELLCTQAQMDRLMGIAQRDGVKLSEYMSLDVESIHADRKRT